MAEDDEYVKSEGLKVKRKTTSPPVQRFHVGREDDRSNTTTNNNNHSSNSNNNYNNHHNSNNNNNNNNTNSNNTGFSSKAEEMSTVSISSYYPQNDPFDQPTYELNRPHISSHYDHQPKRNTVDCVVDHENKHDNKNSNINDNNSDNIDEPSNNTESNQRTEPFSSSASTTSSSSSIPPTYTPSYTYIHESVKSILDGNDADAETNGFDTQQPPPPDSRSDGTLSRDIEQQSITNRRHFDFDSDHDSYASSSSDDEDISNNGFTNGLDRSRRSTLNPYEPYEPIGTIAVTKRNPNTGMTTTTTGYDDDNDHKQYHYHHNYDDDTEQPQPIVKKDPNRFFADLDKRLETMPLVRIESDPKEKPTPSNGSAASTVAVVGSNALAGVRRNGMNWLRNVVPPKIQKSIQKILVEDSKPIGKDGVDGFEVTTNTKKGVFGTDVDGGDDGDEESRIDTVASTAVFAKHESMELERLERRMKNGCVRSAIDSLLENRYLLYIVVPFLLTTLAYFMTRKKTDDSVT